MDTWMMYFVIALLLLLIVLAVSCESHDPLRFHGKFIFYYVVSTMICTLSIPYIALRPKDVMHCLTMSSILKQVTRFLGIKWELRGADELGIQRGCIIVANHQSTLDILGMFNIWQVMGKCTTIARKEVFYVWPFGLAAWLAGVVFIDRKNHANATSILNESSKLIQNHKTKMWIFPEGTRNKRSLGNGLLPFKKGAFRVAIENQVPILPVVYSPYYFINEDTHFFGRGKMIVQTLQAIPTKGLQIKDIVDLMERTRKVMQEAFDALAKEVVAPLPPGYPGLTTVKNKSS